MEDHKSFGEDEITRNLIKKAGIQEPSWDFTSRVMNSILTAKTSEVFKYKPVISNRGWIGIFISVTLFSLVLAYLPGSSNSAPTILSPYLSVFDSISGKILPKISFDFNALQGFTGALAAGWLLFAIDKILRKQKFPA